MAFFEVIDVDDGEVIRIIQVPQAQGHMDLPKEIQSVFSEHDLTLRHIPTPVVITSAADATDWIYS